MKVYLKRSLDDILANGFLTVITIGTIALSILIACAFALFFMNAGNMLNAWEKGVRMMVYLKPGSSEAVRLDTRFQLKRIDGVRKIKYISKDEALDRLKQRMPGRTGLLEDLRENPLPDAFEVTVLPAGRSEAEIEIVAQRILSLAAVSDVEYGKRWLKRFAQLINLFRLAGFAVGGLLFMAAVFIVANTIRLVLYSRREEIEIMRLVGATDAFIKVPFYLEGTILGAVGSVIGLAVLFVGYWSFVSRIQEELGAGAMLISFFSPPICLAIVVAGMLVGLLGCLISLKQFLKT